jgi:putative glutathione S-transferase
MGLLIAGQWRNEWYNTKPSNGAFIRDKSRFRNWLGTDEFPAEANRYHLYVSLACPWAHRTLIFRALKGLTDLISVDVVHPHMLEHGWELKDEHNNSSDSLFGLQYLFQIYQKAKQDYTGRVTVPILWDKQNNTIVSNESSEIIRMFNSAFNHITHNDDDYYREDLRDAIDAINTKVYDNVNNGVYRCGFATTQSAYEEAFHKLFDTLENLDILLSQQRYLVGKHLTEADWRLFTTLLRFDAVYYGHFKCNKKTIHDFVHIQKYFEKLYNHSGIKETVNMTHIKQHYYFSHTTINPTQVVPLGPELTWLD